MNRGETPLVATKLYGYGWWPGAAEMVPDSRGERYEAVAAALQASGTNLALVQNQLDPLPASDVQQTPPAGEYDDLRLRQVLRTRGIRCFEATSMFFQPEIYLHRPELRPVGADGGSQDQTGWYMGLCPSNEEYVDERVQLLQRVATQLEADGLFLSFIRFPGFWESWTPGVQRSAIPEYCFCARCRNRFAGETGTSLPSDLATAAALLQGQFRSQWTAWKCELITGIVARVRQAVHEVAPATEIMINMVPPFAGGLTGIGEDVLGQRAESLAEVTDYFEVMVYHQILNQAPGEWIPSVVARLRAQTERPIIPCLQVRPTYLDGIYRAAGRKPEIGLADFRSCIDAVAASTADGIMTYHWNDVMIEDATAGGKFSVGLSQFRGACSS